MSRSESGKKFGEDRHNLKFLQEIEAISKALYIDKVHQKTLNPSLPEPKPNLKDGYSPPKEKKSIWSWKALKALRHIRNKSFRCCFSLQVHSIHGLPSNLNDLSLYVNLKRRDTVLMTCPVRVCDGNAEFEEQLTYACSVYGSKSGSHNSVKYEAKDFLIYASVVCYDELDLGKHRIDLTRLLPLTFEELEEENCSGKWKTSFKLSGKAQGAIMNVSFGYSMVENHLNMSQIGGKSRVDEDLKHYPELFDSIKMLYLKLEEENSKASVDNKVEAEYNPNSCSFNSAKEIVESNVKVDELSTVGQITNIPSKEEIKLEEDNKDILDENLELYDSINKLFLKLEEETSKTPVNEKVEADFKTSSLVEYVANGWEVNELSTTGQMMNIRLMEEAKLEDYEDMLDENLFTERNREEGYLSNNESVNSNHVDVDESITDDCLNMLENEPESPRERLLKQFEKDTSPNWDSIFNFDFNQENTRFESDDSSSSISSYTDNIFEGSLSKYPNSNLNRFEGVRSYVHTKTGGIVKPINPQLYHDGKNKGILIMQVSSPVVVSAEIGEGIMDISQRLALIGNGKKSVQTRKLMPLEDIDEKIFQEFAWESSPSLEESARSEFGTIEDLVPLAMEKTESLSIERFQIQPNTSNKDASSNIIRGLMGLCLTLDEWTRLDSSKIDGADEISHANSKHEKAGGKKDNTRKYGLMGNKLTIAFMVQIHDQLKNYEPICAPMLGFIQAEMEEQSNEDEFTPKFRIVDVHIADIEAEIRKKILGYKNNRQCRSRWSVASGMKKTNKHPLLKAKILERGVK